MKSKTKWFIISICCGSTIGIWAPPFFSECTLVSISISILTYSVPLIVGLATEKLLTKKDMDHNERQNYIFAIVAIIPAIILHLGLVVAACALISFIYSVIMLVVVLFFYWKQLDEKDFNFNPNSATGGDIQ